MALLGEVFRILRPAAKAVVKSGLIVYREATGVVAEAAGSRPAVAKHSRPAVRRARAPKSKRKRG